MNYQEFMQLSEHEIAQYIHTRGQRVCAFPINGTRRWFMLDHARETPETDFMTQYMHLAGQAHIRVFSMIFDLGVSTILSPTFGPDIMERGEEYTQMALEGMHHLIESPEFLAFYEEYNVRVRFYGEYRKYFAGTAFEPISDLFDELTEKTKNNTANRLFWGIFAHDNVQPLAELSIEYFQETGHIPQRDDLIRAYYGEAVNPVDFFIGFDKFASFDMPLLTTGNEDLYFTLSPSLYMTKQQFREILYDHLITRRQEEPDYSEISTEGWARMKSFYQKNHGNTAGIGHFDDRGQFWYPQAQIKLP